MINDVKTHLHTLYTIKDMRHSSYFLGIETHRNANEITISQMKYALEIIKDAKLKNVTPINDPSNHGIQLSDEGEALSKLEIYRKIIGKLLHMGFTRPDLAHVTQQLSQHMQKPCTHHLQAAQHVLKYLKGTINCGLFYPNSSNLKLRAYCDADWGRCKKTKKSLTGYCIFLSDSLISWKTKKQNVVSKSLVEAEYKSMSQTCCELKWLSYYLTNFQIPIQLSIRLYCDSQAAIAIAQNPVFHERTKHVEIDCHIIRIYSNIICFYKVSTGRYVY